MKLNDTSAVIVSPDPDFAEQIEKHLEFGRLCLVKKLTKIDEIYPAMKKEQIHFVLIDDAPPDLDGVNLTRRMRTDKACPNQQVNIFLFTAEGGSIVRTLEGVNAGAHEMFSKPIGADRILSRIHANNVAPAEFIKSQKYTGPDRRREQAENGSNPGRREEDAQ